MSRSSGTAGSSGADGPDSESGGRSSRSRSTSQQHAQQALQPPQSAQLQQTLASQGGAAGVAAAEEVPVQVATSQVAQSAQISASAQSAPDGLGSAGGARQGSSSGRLALSGPALDARAPPVAVQPAPAEAQLAEQREAAERTLIAARRAGQHASVYLSALPPQTAVVEVLTLQPHLAFAASDIDVGHRWRWTTLPRSRASTLTMLVQRLLDAHTPLFYSALSPDVLVSSARGRDHVSSSPRLASLFSGGESRLDRWGVNVLERLRWQVWTEPHSQLLSHTYAWARFQLHEVAEVPPFPPPLDRSLRRFVRPEVFDADEALLAQHAPLFTRARMALSSLLAALQLARASSSLAEGEIINLLGHPAQLVLMTVGEVSASLALRRRRILLEVAAVWGLPEQSVLTLADAMEAAANTAYRSAVGFDREPFACDPVALFGDACEDVVRAAIVARSQVYQELPRHQRLDDQAASLAWQFMHPRGGARDARPAAARGPAASSVRPRPQGRFQQGSSWRRGRTAGFGARDGGRSRSSSASARRRSPPSASFPRPPSSNPRPSSDSDSDSPSSRSPSAARRASKGQRDDGRSRQ
jgi:hypothetical protein